MSDENKNWEQSVADVVIKDNKVLLTRHTYENVKGMLIIPSSYVIYRETPQQALKREYYGRNEHKSRATEYIWH